MEVFSLTLTQMLVMFSYIAIGFLLKKLRLLPDNAGTVLSKLENYVLVPALVFDSFIANCSVGNLRDNYSLIFYSLILAAIGVAVAIPLSKPFSVERTGGDAEYRRKIYIYALTFGNFGFMGNAIALGVLGDAGLFKYLLFTLPLNILVYTWGMVLLTPKGESNRSVWKNLFNPIFVALLLGLVLGIFDVKSYLPAFITTTVSGAKACMAPVAMILTGFIIGGYEVKSLITKKRIYLASLLRLIIIPSAMLGILMLFNAGKEIMTFTVFAFASPLGLNTIVFPAAFGGDTKTGAAMGIISHTLSVITLPVIYLIFIVLL